MTQPPGEKCLQEKEAPLSSKYSMTEKSSVLYLVIEPVLSIESAEVIHGENMALVVDPIGFGHS